MKSSFYYYLKIINVTNKYLIIKYQIKHITQNILFSLYISLNHQKTLAHHWRSNEQKKKQVLNIKFSDLFSVSFLFKNLHLSITTFWLSLTVKKSQKFVTKFYENKCLVTEKGFGKWKTFPIFHFHIQKMSFLKIHINILMNHHQQQWNGRREINWVLFLWAFTNNYLVEYEF